MSFGLTSFLDLRLSGFYRRKDHTDPTQEKAKNPTKKTFSKLLVIKCCNVSHSFIDIQQAVVDLFLQRKQTVECKGQERGEIRHYF